jgi:hypothetical protein
MNDPRSFHRPRGFFAIYFAVRKIFTIFAPRNKTKAIMTQLTVSIEDVSMLDQIKQAISLLRGVSSVTLKRSKKTSMDRAIEDIEQGRVYKYNSLDDLIKEIENE